MKKRSYYEQLKDPRWQKRRLEILNGAEFACELCGDSESTLHVHHLRYEKGKAPWEYEDRFLACLCEGCHSFWHDAKATLDVMVAGLDPDSILRVAAYAFGVSGECATMLDKGAQGVYVDHEKIARANEAPIDPVVKGLLDAIGEGIEGVLEGGFAQKKLIWQSYMYRLTGERYEG